MHVTINLNELIDQISNLANKNAEAITESARLFKKVQELETKLVDFETEKLKAQIDKDRELEELSQQFKTNLDLPELLKTIKKGA